ncbi:putative sodium-dependent multivitamin transporter [Daktulosphaira vitifoliae]|uniref:putative sodium-dependent multivitamin transporter n=1 Tax=Daktulosphaira vitifoliae TaxID=58002 RepID=UPI0021A9C009|nr:putative sodium-dependent multivitamin transporter [Daktulosphaira vitifoliae]
MAFAILDSVVLGCALLGSVLIGLYYRITGGRQKTTEEYILGDKNLSVIPVGFSLMASFMCATTMFGLSSENYMRGTHFMVINASNILGTPIVAYLFLPVFFKLGYVSIYQYLEERFGKMVRTATSLAFSLQTILRTALVLYAAAIATDAITGIPQVISMIGVGVICIFYSTIGGIKAVIITDLFQSILMFASVFAVIIISALEVGGLTEIWNIANEYGRVNFSNFQIDPTVRHSWWSLFIGGMFTYVSVYATNQVQVQRYLTMKNYDAAVKTLWFSWPLTAFLSLAMCFSGLAIFVKYRDCDPLKTHRIESGEQLMSLFVLDTMGSIPGLTGLYLSGVWSSAMCTVSAALNSLAAVTLEDYILPFSRAELSDKNRVVFLKLMVIVYGILSIMLGYCAQYVGSLLEASMSLLGIIGGPILAIFTLGIFVPYVNQKGSLIGLTIGLVFLFVIGLGGPKPRLKNLPTYTNGCKFENNLINSTLSVTPIYKDSESYIYLFRISYMYYIVLGFLTTSVVALIASLCFKSDVKDLKPILLSSLVSKRIMNESENARNKRIKIVRSVSNSKSMKKIEIPIKKV